MGLDERLRALGTDTSEPPHGLDVDAALAATQVRRRRRRRGRMLAVGGVAALLVVCVGAIALAIGDGDSAEEVAIGGGPATTAPEEPSRPGEVFVWVSEPEIPVGTETLAVTLANPPDGAASPTFGVGAELERWDGQQWQPDHLVALCLDAWLCPGQLASPDQPPLILAIGLGAAPGSVGSVLWLPTAELEEGSYRLLIGGRTVGAADEHDVTAFGRFDVVADAATLPPPPRPLDPPQLEIAAAVVPPAGGPVTLGLVGLGTAQEVEAFWSTNADRGSSGEPTLERWNDGAWEPVEGIGGSAPANDNPLARTLVLPALAPGAYRLAVASPDGHIAEARFWAEDVFGSGTSPASPPAEEVDPSAPPDDRSAVLAAAALDRATVRSSLSGPLPADLYVIDRLGVVGAGSAIPDPSLPGAVVLSEEDRAAVEAAFAPQAVRWVSPDEWHSLLGELGLDPAATTLVITLTEPVIVGDRATVVSAAWCGGLCGMGGTQVVERQPDGTWVVTGTEGSQWIS